MMEKDNKRFWQRFARVYGPEMNVLELACGSG